MNEKLHTRRKFFKYLGLSGAGVAFASSVDAGKEKMQAGGEDAKEEIEKLKKAYEELDGRSKLMLRAMFFFTGLDVFF